MIFQLTATVKLCAKALTSESHSIHNKPLLYNLSMLIITKITIASILRQQN
jgi:hypothetical protein